MKFISKEAWTSNIIATIMKSTQQPGHVFMTSFCPRDFVQMASDKPFNYHSGLWLLSSQIVLHQTSSKLLNESIEDSEVDNCLDKFPVGLPWGEMCKFQYLPHPASLEIQIKLCYISLKFLILHCQHLFPTTTSPRKFHSIPFCGTALILYTT